ncbi:MAG: hypothetical protein J5449_04105 [Oscillospiraceae bacterium]|nr:hypothetical protein [Oscillospiraceae bacterium]
MELLEDGILAALAAVGLVTLLALPVSALSRPRRGAPARAYAVVPCGAGGAETLEQTVRALERLRRESGCFQKTVILDCGMDEETKRLAVLLCREGAVLRDAHDNIWEDTT